MHVVQLREGLAIRVGFAGAPAAQFAVKVLEMRRELLSELGLGPGIQTERRESLSNEVCPIRHAQFLQPC